MGSRRLPGKSLMRIRGIPLLQYVIERVRRARTVERVILATSTGEENDPLCLLAETLGIGVYRGSEEDVLSRFAGVARETGAEILVRICADNPLVDPGEIDRLVAHHIETGAHYSFNHVPTRKNRYPDGLGAEAINAGILTALAGTALTGEEREHVTLRIRRQASGYVIGEPVAPPEILGPDIRLDVDTPEDFERMKGFIESLPEDQSPYWTAAEIVRCYRKHFRSKVIILLNSRGDARVFCSLYHGRIAGGIPLAASPGAWWDLEKRGIPCLLIQDYFDRAEIYRLGMGNFRSVEEVCRIVDGRLRERHEEIRIYGLEPARFDLSRLKFLLDNLSIRANLVGKVVERERPDLLCFVVEKGRDKPPDQDPDAYFREDLNWFPALLDLGAGGCAFTTLEYGEDDGPAGKGQPFFDIRGFLRGTLPRLGLLYPILFTSKISGLRKALRIVPSLIANRFRGTRRLLLFGYGYDWNRMLPAFTLQGYSLCPVTGTGKGSGRGEFPVDTSWKGEARNFLVSGGVDLSPLVVPYLILGLERTFSSIPGAIRGAEQVFGSGKPVALLSGPRQAAVEHLVVRLAKKYNLPVITWQHGAYGPFRVPMMLYSEFMNSDIVLLWGSGVQETMGGDPLNTFPCRAIPVGSCELQAMYQRKGGKPGHGSILYVTTGYFGNQMYVSYEHPFHDNELWEVQKAILGALGNRRRAMVKPHPSGSDADQFEEFIRDRGYGNLTVVRDPGMSFADLLGDADTVIIDFPSTTLLQAIAAGKTVFVFTGHLRLGEKALALLQKRAYVRSDLREFIGLLRDYLDGKPLKDRPDNGNTEFLERYGVERLDNGVAGRVLAVLEEVRGGRTPGSP
jgi:spore coat polysaccharide biosynthesis protein SpsF